MYACGITPYSYAHIGHARSAIAYDILRRYLIYKGYEVKYIHNITDIDDKIIQRANINLIHPLEYSKYYGDAYLEDLDALNILPATAYPKVSEYINEIQDFIQQLMDKGFAYQTEDGIYFDLSKAKDYGKLSHRHATADGDFALWKFSDTDPSWETKWGKKGRPGWHIECSTMILHTLGKTIDIHGGGLDLKFPHHENEIIQSEALNDQPLANYWLHNGMLLINGQKMSKSLNNFITIRDVLTEFEPMTLRLLFLQSHYRSPINITHQSLQGSQKAYLKLKKATLHAPTPLNQQAIADFEKAMNNDLNTAQAIAILFKLTKEKDSTTIKYIGDILGIAFN
jgi:cysteinyl-tRNA synthetase